MLTIRNYCSIVEGSKVDNKKTHVEKTSADKNEIGFKYQYYYFLWKVLSLTPNQSVGLEILDDVHI